jgi:hypothetical protein
MAVIALALFLSVHSHLLAAVPWLTLSFNDPTITGIIMTFPLDSICGEGGQQYQNRIQGLT